MTTTRIALVTGANKGIGLAVARRLAGHGMTVLLGSRDLGRGVAAAAGIDGDVHPIALDMTDDASVDAAALRVMDEWGGLDVLINNAGIAGALPDPAEATADDLRTVYETNVFGPVRVTHALLPALRRRPDPRVIMVSSMLGSLTRASDPAAAERAINALGYPSAKAALNMITVKYAAALPDVQVIAVCPGHTATDLNGHRGQQTVEQGSDAIVAAATAGPGGPTGIFADRHGVAPW